ncbi:MAG: Do family serine endopeptidase [Alkalispirochaetaceae bacterium]
MAVALAVISFLAGAGAFALVGTEVVPSQQGSRLVAETAGADSAPSSLRSMEHAFNRVAEEVLPVVVEINVVEVISQNIPRFQSPWEFFFGPPEFQERQFRRPGLGSGVIVRREGREVYVLSNNHVVGDADEISIRLHDGREYQGKIVGKDERTDLALVSFETPEEVPVARLGDSDALDVGDWVLAVGNPFGFESTVTAGIVSALRRDPQPGVGIAEFTDYIQTDAAINPGNSGGALVNLDGEVVGINTWIASRSGGSVGLGFAIPINDAKRAIEEFLTRGRIVYGWLGVTIEDAENGSLRDALSIGDASGALVTNIVVDSPADRDGIVPGDFITAVDGSPVTDARALSRMVGLQPAGSSVTVELLRNGERRQVRVTLSERDENRDTGTLWPGFTVAPLTRDIRATLDIPERHSGVVVNGVARGTPAAITGIRRGDIVESVGDSRTASVADFYRALSSAGEEVIFRILRGEHTLRLGIVKPQSRQSN